MRWLKHMTATRQDEKVAILIDKAGWEGYGLWWGILEIVAARMDKSSTKCSLKYPISRWAAELQLLPQNVCRKVAVLGAVGLLSISRDDAGLELSIPNLLKYRDEYSKKSGHSTDNVSPKIQRQIQIQNTETEILKPLQQKPLRVVPPISREPSQEDLLIAKYAPLIHKRHVARKCSLKIVCEKLKAILVKTRSADRAAVMETIDSNHEQHCVSEAWTKEGGQFCPGLEKWLSPKHERYLTPPDAEVTHTFQNGIVADTMRYLNEH